MKTTKILLLILIIVGLLMFSGCDYGYMEEEVPEYSQVELPLENNSTGRGEQPNSGSDNLNKDNNGDYSKSPAPVPATSTATPIYNNKNGINTKYDYRKHGDPHTW